MDAAAAQACWNELVVGGNKFRVMTLDMGQNDCNLPLSQQVLQAKRNLRTASLDNVESLTPTLIEIFSQNFLTDDDYADEDCLE
jgi:hypothetical protein